MMPRYEGQLLANRFHVGREIAQGRSGTLYEATAIDSDASLAIRLMRARDEEDDTIGSFLAALERASALSGMHAAPILAAGSLPGGTLYVVTPLYRGRSLARVLAESGRLSFERLRSYGLQICAALRDAHARGIVHGDLKPSNVFIARDGERETVKLLDLGLPKHLLERPPGLIVAADGIGTPGYASPEQIVAPSSVDAKSDVWALGVLLHEAASGQLPFRARTPTAVFGRVLSESPPPLTSLRADVGRDLEAVVLGCMASDLGQRYPNVSVVAAELERCRAHAAPEPRRYVDLDPVVLPKRRSAAVWAALPLGALLAAYAVGKSGFVDEVQVARVPILGETAAIGTERGAVVLDSSLPRGVYPLQPLVRDAIGKPALRAEPERPLDTEDQRIARSRSDNGRARGYIESERLKSPADVYVRERRTFDEQGNLLGVERQLIE